MFYIETHQQWKELMDRELRGESIEAQLEPGYKQAYEAWKMENKELLPKLSAEDRAEHFIADLQENILTQKKQVIEALSVSADEKKKLLALAQKDQLLLVSTDEGAHFDQVLTLEQASKADPLKTRILSQTLISSTVDLEKVIEEQTLLHVVSNFKGAGYEIHDARLVDHVVKMEVSKPKKTVNDQEIDEHVSFDVPVNQDALLPLEYYVTKEGKETHFPETVLPEEVGVPKPDSSFLLATKEGLGVIAVESAFDSGNASKKDLGKEALLASFSAMSGLELARSEADLNRRAQLIQEYEREQAQFGEKQKQFEIRANVSHAPMIDVMGAKGKFQAQKAREKKDDELQARVKKSRDEKYERDQRIALAKQAEQLKAQSLAKQSSRNIFRWGTALGATGAAGFTAGLAGLGLWVG